MLRTVRQYLIFALAPLMLLAAGTSGAQTACVTPTTGQLIVWHAGSLGASFSALEKDFLCQTGITVTDKAAGSLDMIRQVTAGGQAADIVAPADYLDIDYFLKPYGFANYDILFAQDKMVLAYCVGTGKVCAGTSKQSANIAAPGSFSPSGPASDAIPDAVPNWSALLTTPGVVIGGSHLYLDPSGYRAPMIFNLAQNFYGVPNLYDALLEHYLVTPATSPLNSGVSYGLGLQYDYSLTYQHNAYANAAEDPNYRYVNLPKEINLGDSTENAYYLRAVIVEPGLYGTGFVPLPATKLIWGATILKTAPNPANAVKFLQLLLGPTGQAALNQYGPAPISPAIVRYSDFHNLPSSLQPLVTAGPVFP